MNNIIKIVFLIILTKQLFGQAVEGKVVNDKDEELIGASIYILESQEGTTTNLKGRFNLINLERGNYTLLTSFIGFNQDTTIVFIDESDVFLTINMIPKTNSIEEVVVRADKIVERTSISNVSFSKKDLRTSQGLIEDPLRTLASLPGIGRGGDLFSPSALYVRGGDPNENLFLLDNNKIYFPYYFGGQKSIFNTDVTESIELLTGGFSAMYGNHMSSVLNVTTRDGNMECLSGMVSFGFYNASGIIEGPIKKGKTSGLLAVRRTYLDLFLKETAEFPVPTFGDITFKLSHIINENHKLSLSGISSDESLDFLVKNPTPGLPNRLKTAGNNHFQSLQLQSRFGKKIYNKLSLTNALSKSKADIGTNLFLDIDGWQSGLRNDVSIRLSDKSKIRTGVEWQYGQFQFDGTFPLDPSQTDPNDTTIVLQEVNVDETGEGQRSAYILYDGIILKGLGINGGLRWDYNPDNKLSDFSPRLAINYQLLEKSKLRFASGIYNQFPGDGVPKSITSEQAIHYIFGIEHQFSQNIYGWIEAYYKDYNNLIINDRELNFSNEGVGSARGIEVFIRKEKGILNGWVSYALSNSRRTVPLSKEVKDFGFDQRHIFNFVGQYHIKKWEEKEKWYLPVLVHTNFRYADGTPYTPIESAIQTGQGWVPIQGDLLSERNMDYVNVNLRVEWNFKVGKKGLLKGVSFTEAWNLFGRKNVLGRNYQYGLEYPNNVNVNEYYSTPFLMAGGFRIEF